MTHRYWRINCTANNNSWPSFQASEIQFRAAVGGPKLVGTYAASNYYTQDASFPPQNANDGDFTTYFATDGTFGLPQYLYIDLGAGNSANVREVAFAPRVANSTYLPSAFTVDYSDDLSTWTNLASITGITASQYQDSTLTAFTVDSTPIATVPLTLTNPDAETGDSSGWTMIIGSGPGVANTNDTAGYPAFAGTYYFTGSADQARAKWGQTVAIPTANYSDVDAGSYGASMSVWVNSYSDNDAGRIGIQALDGSGNVLKTSEGILLNPTGWTQYSETIATLPIGTRSLLIYTDNFRDAGTECDIYYDNFALSMIPASLYPYRLPIINPNGETGDTTGWTKIIGANGYSIYNDSSVGGQYPVIPNAGSYYFCASSNDSHNQVGQYIALPQETWTSIDAGLYSALATVWMSTYADPADNDYGSIAVQFLDIDGNVLNTCYAPYQYPNTWTQVGTRTPTIPKGTRKVLLFTDNLRNNGTELSVYYEGFELFLVAPTFTTVGQAHRYWRLSIDFVNNGSAGGAGDLPSMNAIRFYDDQGNQLSGTISTLTAYDLGGYPSAYLTDGDNNTLWAANFMGGYNMPNTTTVWQNSGILFDLGAGNSAALGSVTVRSRSGYTDQNIYTFRFQSSDNGSVFADEAFFARSNSWADQEERTFKLMTDRWRIWFYGYGNGGYNECDINQVEFHGTVGGADLTVPCDSSTGLGGHCFGTSGNVATSGVFNDSRGDNYVGTGSASDQRWVEWAFDTPTEIAEIGIGPRQSYSGQAPNVVRVLRSVDNGFTYTEEAYFDNQINWTGTEMRPLALVNGQNMEVVKSNQWVVEGSSPHSINVNKMNEWVVEGPVVHSIVATKLNQWIVDGPSKIAINKMNQWIVEGPPETPVGPFSDIGGHRYWRILYKMAHNNNSAYGITDIQMFRAPATGPDYNLIGFPANAVAMGSSTQDATNYGYANAFDGIGSTLWQTTSGQASSVSSGHVLGWGTGEWIGYDFGASWAPQINRIGFTPDKDDTNRSPAVFEVQSSDDGTNWTMEWLGFDNVYNPPAGVYRYFSRPVFTDQRKAEFWGLQVVDNSRQGQTFYAAASEIQFHNIEQGSQLCVDGTKTNALTANNGPASNAIDGNINTFWATSDGQVDGGSMWWYDFSNNPQEIREVVITSRNDSAYYQAPTIGKMFRSNDGVNWQYMWGFSTTYDWAQNETRTFATTLPVAGTTTGPRRNRVIVVD